MFRYLDYVVHISVCITFPIRGHFYKEYDRHRGCHKLKDSCCHSFELNGFVGSIYTDKPSYKSRSIGKVRMFQEHPCPIEHGETYNGFKMVSEICGPIRILKRTTTKLPYRQFFLVPNPYFGSKILNHKLVFELKSLSYFRLRFKANIAR